jgi:hypothetical protein
MPEDASAFGAPGLPTNLRKECVLSSSLSHEGTGGRVLRTREFPHRAASSVGEFPRDALRAGPLE